MDFTQLNSNLVNKLKITTILSINTYNTNTEYTSINNANAFTYFIPTLVWRQGSIVAKRYHDDVYDVIDADVVADQATICVVRHATFLINRTTGAVKIKEINQENLQSDGNFIFGRETMEGLGLFGINW